MNFKVNLEGVAFEIQYNCRKTCISGIFWKNFASATVCVLIFQMTNYKYCEIFAESQMNKYVGKESKQAYVEEQLKGFNSVLLIGNVTAGTCLLSVATQFIFNAFSQENLP